MSFIEQLIQFLSDPPGSFYYHLLVLLALQIVFALSFARARQDTGDDMARRMTWAAAAMFAGNLLLLFGSLFLNNDPQRAARLLPPLESAIDTAVLSLLIWSFLSQPAQARRASNVLLLLTLLLTGVLFLFSWQAWQAIESSGVLTYNGSTPATIWALLQIALLSAALVYLLLRERQLGPLPPALLGVLLVAHVATLWNYPEFIATATNVAYWNRLGYLVALPLWAVFAYEQVVAPRATRGAATLDELALSRALEGAARLLGTRQTSRRVAIGLALAQELLQPAFTAVAFLDADDPQMLLFRSNLPAGEDGRFQQWKMPLNESQALQTVINQDKPVELQAAGLGARQYYALYNAAALEPQGALLLLPLTAAGRRLGLLLVGADPAQESWTPEMQQAATAVAGFLAAAILDSQDTVNLGAAAPTPESPAPATAVPAAIVMDRVRLRDLERERDELRAALDEAVAARQTAEGSAVAAQKQARYLAAALRVAQTPRNPDNSGASAPPEAAQELPAETQQAQDE